MISPPPIDSIRKSYGRCISSSGFFSDFHNTLISKSGKISSIFQTIHQERGEEILRDTIAIILMHSKDNGTPFTTSTLQHIHNIYSQHNLNIDNQLMNEWADCLIQTIKTHDTRFTQQLEIEWRSIIQPITTFLTKPITDANTTTKPQA